MHGNLEYRVALLLLRTVHAVPANDSVHEGIMWPHIQVHVHHVTFRKQGAYAIVPKKFQEFSSIFQEFYNIFPGVFVLSLKVLKTNI